MIGERIFALAKMKRNVEVTVCPSCKANTTFSFHAVGVNDSFYRSWVVCKCGFDPTKKKPSMRIEMPLNTPRTTFLFQALQVWGDAIERQPLVDFIELFEPKNSHGLVAGIYCYDSSYRDIHEAAKEDLLYLIVKKNEIPYEDPRDPHWRAFVIEQMQNIATGMSNAATLFGGPEPQREIVWFDGEHETTLSEMVTEHPVVPEDQQGAPRFLKAGIYIMRQHGDLRVALKDGTAHLVSDNVPLFMTTHEGVENVCVTMTVLKNSLAVTDHKEWAILYFDGKQVMTEEAVRLLYLDRRLPTQIYPSRMVKP